MTAMSRWRRLDRPILSKVSRSFYLSLRVLPRPLRLPIGLAYLLARASDTIADAAHISVEHRLEHLDHLRAMLQSGALTGDCRKINDEIGRNLTESSERLLLSRLHEALLCLHHCDEWDRHEITNVLHTIITGQSLDVSRFGVAQPGEVIALQSDDALIEYTDLVAGCVGVFWTNLCQHHWRGYSRLSRSELLEWGASFGRGLQLVNILRDLPADLENGRCYLPVDPAAFVVSAQEELIRARARWLDLAYNCLADGWRYARSLRSVRLRYATWLPALLGIQTLNLVTIASWPTLCRGVKVSRRALKRLCAEALLGAMSTRVMDRSYRRVMAQCQILSNFTVSKP